MATTGTLAPQESLAPTTAPRRRGRTALAALAAAAAGLAVWWLEAGERLDDVHVVAAPNGVTCRSGEVTVPGQGEPQSLGFAVPVVQAAPGMACSVTVLVVNRSGSEVTLERVAVPGMGPSTRGAARVTEVSPYGPVSPPPPENGFDAAVDVIHPLNPGEVWEVSVQLVYNEKGCAAGRGAARPDGPFVTVRALGRSSVRAPVLPTFAVLGDQPVGTVCSSD